MPKEARRAQLLETAKGVLRERGADALTLALVAECAGVTKPVAYEHFGTREGLLIELYREIDGHHLDALRQALQAAAPPRLAAVVAAVCESYLDCARDNGAEWQAIAAALRGSEAMAAVQQELTEAYVRELQRAFAPFSALPAAALRLRCIGVAGAAENISRELIRGQASESAVAAALRGLMTELFDADRPAAAGHKTSKAPRR
ncbi:TetR/AcrR family transcriptional regulator [Roseateles sp. DAIF2]|nr:TetR/AcrR family transcriptional regulator [Roseateles sp. DAIF2]